MASTDVIGGGNIEPRALEDEMRTAYLDYAMCVIVGRALPDVRDGLKPVHRRVLYSMDEIGPGPDPAVLEVGAHRRRGDGQLPPARRLRDLRHARPHGAGLLHALPARRRPGQLRLHRRRSRRGDALHRGAPHPPRHRDAPRSRRGHGRLHAQLRRIASTSRSSCRRASPTCSSTAPPGSPSAWRRTSRRTTCARSSARSSPSSTTRRSTPPGSCSTSRARTSRPAGIILGRQGILDAYETGRGRVRVRAKAHTEDIGRGKEAIIVTELPYMVKKGGDNGLVKKIADLVHEKRLTGIANLEDQSDRRGMRLVIELKRDAIPEVVLNQLYKHTPMQTTFGVNMVALVDNVPRTLPLRRVLVEYVQHQREVIVRRSKHELGVLERRVHVLEGLLIAQDNLDAVIETIRASRDRDAARVQLIERFSLTDIQASAILDLRLSQLTALEADTIKHRARRQARAHRRAARDPRRRAARPRDHQGGAPGDRRAVRRRAAHAHHRLRGRDRHRGPDRRPADGHHDHEVRLHQVAAAGHVPPAAPRRPGRDRDGHEGRRLHRAPLRVARRTTTCSSSPTAARSTARRSTSCRRRRGRRRAVRSSTCCRCARASGSSPCCPRATSPRASTSSSRRGAAW